MAKPKEILSYISLTVGIVSGILAISEKLTSWNILASLYPLIDQGTLFLVLVVVTFACLAAYILGARSRRPGFVFFGKARPSSLDTRDSYEATYYDVRWRVYLPRSLSLEREAWVEGPYCPKCKRELEEATTGTLRKRPIWICPSCDIEYEKPKGDVKEAVRKEFEAYLRRKGEL